MLTVVGFVMAAQSLRAFNATRWQALSLPSERVWLGLLVLAWILGILLTWLLPQSVRWTLPPLIVLASSLSSLLFLSVTLRGLKSPVECEPLSGELLPRHIVFLSTAVSASFSTIVSVALEGIFLGAVMAVLLVVTRWLGDQLTLDMIEGIARDPETLRRLVELIVSSPVALAGLGCILVFVAPLIEETAKGLPLFLFARQGSRLTEQTAILLGVTSGVGFAFAENVGYMSMLADSWWLAFWLRVCSAVMHGAASGFVGRAWYYGIRERRWGAMLADSCKGWGVHALWNALALLVGWFAYNQVIVGVAFCVLVGLLPLTIFFALMARWGIWVSDT